MNFKRQKRILIWGTILTLVLTSGVFTFFTHINFENSRVEVIESKLKGDAQSILPHLYTSGNYAWFNSNLDQYKKFGLPCLSVRNGQEIIWGDEALCEKLIEARNYVDQRVFDISYTLPAITLRSTLEANGISFSIFFFIQMLFLLLAYKVLALINKRHSDTLIQIEHIKGVNEANDRVLRLTKTIGHNLKSPLAALKTLYQLAAHKLNLDEVELLKSIQSNIDAMTGRLINQEFDNPPASLVEVSKTIGTLINMKRIEFSGKNTVQIVDKIEEGLFGLVNETELSSILSNLINNSVEAGGSEIKISALKGLETMEILVRDNGHGISEEEISKLFKYGATTKKTGKGCGLFHAKEIITSWNGEISITSAIGAYTEVRIALPVQEKRFKREIVLIDDEPLNILSWKGMANKYGIPFKGFVNSQEFFKNLPLDKDSVEIFVDYELGEENGLEVVHDLISRGFVNVSLATGQMESVSRGIRQVGKEFPLTVQ